MFFACNLLKFLVSPDHFCQNYVYLKKEVLFMVMTWYTSLHTYHVRDSYIVEICKVTHLLYEPLA